MRRFIIPMEKLESTWFDDKGKTKKRSVAMNNGMFADIILWTLEQESISGNVISENFHIGWRRANIFVRQLNECGLVNDLDAKLPRKVLPQSIEEVPEKVLDILQSNGISLDEISDTLHRRVKK